MTRFTEVQPTLENHWRSIILFGRNVASYKFALGKSLLELSGPFSRCICEHLKIADKQSTSSSSKFLQACRKFNRVEITEDELRNVTARLGFNNVIDASHVVQNGEIEVRFFEDERQGKTKGIRLTDDLFRLHEQYQYRNLPSEVEARWRLVETAWQLDLPRHVLSVEYDPDGDFLIVQDRRLERRPITACRDALNGYQKGKCFYCFRDISIERFADNLADVDHFFPHTLKPHGFGDSIDKVWNLVLACRVCNRGERGKFDRLPDSRLLGRLHQRNSFLIDSHHPLRNTLMTQTGQSEPERRRFLKESYKRATEILVQTWHPKDEDEPTL